MTMIAIANYGDHIETMTDTMSYTRIVTELGPECTKIMAIPHLSAAVLTQGNSKVGAVVKATTLHHSGEVATFDELLEDAPTLMRAVWEAQVEDAGGPEHLGNSTGFLVGYSEHEQTFVAYGYAPEADFTPFQIEGMFVTPSPWTLRPSPLEYDRACREKPDDTKLLERWAKMPAPALPASMDDWLALARTVREERALEWFLKVIVAGRMVHTRIERGSVHTQTVGRFNDRGPELLQMLGTTWHRTAQYMECPCGSGEFHIDCHLAPLLSEPCGCLSGRELWECCAVQGDRDANIEATRRYWANEGHRP